MTRLLLSASAVLALLGGTASAASPRATSSEIPADYPLSFQPLPLRFEAPAKAGIARPSSVASARVALGRQLFFDPRLSRSGRIACTHCHDLLAFGADGRKVSSGHAGQLGRRNAPTVYNAAGFFAQFWDGRSPDVEDQARQPILNPVEMAMPDGEAVVRVLAAIPEYAQAFERAFPGEQPALGYHNVGVAIGAFERGLSTPGRFDAFLRGDEAALDARERRGFRRFVELGCAGCHNGPALGGQTYERLGHVRPAAAEADLGREEVTRDPADRMRFRVPGLRNVARTGPYYHDGRFPGLAAAVRDMAALQVGLELAAEDEAALLAFLEALTGELPEAYIEPPVLPPDPPGGRP